MKSAPLNLIVALPAEALPLLRHFALKSRGASDSLPIFAGEGIRLIRSGPGKTAARSAVDQLHALYPQPAAWLNLGIAGHPYLPLGIPLLARRITDRETGQWWAPAIPFPPPCATAEIFTVDTPETTYPRPGAYDMEASGFFAAAQPLARAGQVHCLKIVSDNPQRGHRRITGALIEELVEKNLALIDRLIHAIDG